MAEIGTAYVTIKPRWEATHLAQHIEVRQGKDPGTFSLKIDGQEFPWMISDDGVITTSSIDGAPAVTVTILTEKLSTKSDALG